MRLAHRVCNACGYQSVVLHPLLSDVPVVALTCLMDSQSSSAFGRSGMYICDVKCIRWPIPPRRSLPPIDAFGVLPFGVLPEAPHPSLS